MYSGVILASPILSTALGVWQTRLHLGVAQGIMRRLRLDVYTHLQLLPLRWFTSTRGGGVQSLLSNDLGAVNRAVTSTVPNIVSNGTRVLATVSGMAYLSWQLSLISVAVLPLFIVVTTRVGRVRRRITSETHRTFASMSALTEETLSLSGYLLTKVYGSQEVARGRYMAETDQLMRLWMRQQVIGTRFRGFIQTVFSVLPASAYVIAGVLLHAGRSGGISLGNLVAFTVFQSQLFVPVGQLLGAQVEMQGLFAVFERIWQYLDEPVGVGDRPGATSLAKDQIRGEVAFRDVSFSYDSSSGRPAVEQLTFSILPGQLVALVGRSGAGKTTVAYLAARLYEAEGGCVTLDGYDVRDLTEDTLRDAVAVVTQETFLFHGTIAENLRLAKADATDEELVAAAQAASIHERICQLPGRYDTEVGERGYRFSGGERQRLALARAALRSPRVLILDEATSGVDAEREAEIRGSLRRLMGSCTTLVIAHRLSTVIDADCILMLDRGRIVDSGTHSEMLARGGPYANLYFGRWL